MDLQTISAQMKIVIQKHQIVVTEMRNDPQDPVLQKRLHDLQLEIHSLNERQKQIVEDLRKNLEKKQGCPNSSPNNCSGYSATSPSPHHPKQETQLLCTSPKHPTPNHTIPTTSLVASKPTSICVNTVRQTVPPTVNNIVAPTTTFTFKAPVGTVVLPNCSTANALKVAEHKKTHPVLVVPSPSNRAADGSQTGVLFNLVPPIRVPQYPPPIHRNAAPVTCQKNQVINNCIPVTFTATTTQSNCSVDGKLQFPTKDSTVNSSEKHHNNIKNEHKIDPKKKAFMLSLGLVSRETLSDIKNKKMERKRRSTANPQFSNAALEEKWRNAAQASASSQKRPRGRPRLESKQTLCPPTSNGVSSSTGNVECGSPAGSNYTVSSSSSPVSDSPALINGGYKLNSNSEDAKNVEQMLSGLCIVCTQPGDLVKCDTCAKQQHLNCMQPPLTARPQGPWQCSDCQSRTVSLIVVQSYDVLKAGKEDEKRKLLKKSLELRLKRSQLESRLNQLRELSGKQKNRQSEMTTSLKDLETLVERFHTVINDLRHCS